MLKQKFFLFCKTLNSILPVHRYFQKVTQCRKLVTLRKMNNNNILYKQVSCNCKVISSHLDLLPMQLHYKRNQERLLFSQIYNLRKNTKLNFSTISTNSQNDEQNLKNGVMKKLKFVILFLTIVSAPIMYKVWKKKEEVENEPEDKTRSSIKIPQFSKDIPDYVPFVLIGGGTASFSAFRSIKTIYPTAKVLILANENQNPYMRPPLSKELIYVKDRDKAKQFIFKQWNGDERSVYFEPDEFFIPCEELIESENGGLSIARGWSVHSIDPLDKIITLEDGKEIKYGKCLLATGSLPRKLSVTENLPTKLQEKIFYYRSIQDYENIDQIIDNGQKSIAIYGGGFLGSELATSISRRAGTNVKIVQIVRGETVVERILPRYLSDLVKTKIEEHGVLFINKANIKNIEEGNSGMIKLNLTNSEEIEVHHLIVCIGSEPNVEVAKNSGLEIDPDNGGIVTNAELMARSDLYVAGDCVSYYDPILKIRRNIQHHDHAVITGRIAAENMFGAARPFTHQSMFWSEVGFNVNYEGVGDISSDLPTFAIFAADNIEIQEVSQEHQTKPKYSRGMIFYLRENVIVGILFWNIFNKISLARQVIAEQRVFEDLNEVAKLFNIYSD